MKIAFWVAAVASCLLTTACAPYVVIGSHSDKLEPVETANVPPDAARARATLRAPDFTSEDYGRASAAIVNRWLTIIPWGFSTETGDGIRIEPGMTLRMTSFVPGAGSMPSQWAWEVPTALADPNAPRAALGDDRLSREDFLAVRYLFEAARAPAAQQAAAARSDVMANELKVAQAKLQAIEQAVCHQRKLGQCDLAKDRAEVRALDAATENKRKAEDATSPFDDLYKCLAERVKALSAKEITTADPAEREGSVQEYHAKILKELIVPGSLTLWRADFKLDDEDPSESANGLFFRTTAFMLRERLTAVSPLVYRESGKRWQEMPHLALRTKVCGSAAETDLQVPSDVDWFYSSLVEDRAPAHIAVDVKVRASWSAQPLDIELGTSIDDIERRFDVDVLALRRAARWICAENKGPYGSGTAVREGEECSLTLLGKSPSKRESAGDLKGSLLKARRSSPDSDLPATFAFDDYRPPIQTERFLMLPSRAKKYLVAAHGDELITRPKRK